MGKIAVLTNDLQYDLVHKNPQRSAVVAEATPVFVKFLEEIRQRGHIVVHLQLISLADDATAERKPDGTLYVASGSAGAEILEEFLDPGDIVLEKNKDSGFYETDLHDRLQQAGVDTVVITGMQTQICVQTTAADAFFRGYNVWVPADCVVSTNPADRDRALEWLGGYCATVVDAAELIDVLDANGHLPRKAVVAP
ncbi:isochorismatase family cysteine hydrolase [Actinokineospora globicatena]|uniref:Isochorismatase n=1 Tax=Actinokineospora globicatena TaxID=103729 RepID=A0A9W6V5Y6_9PSEU|nr:isochorismatase family cysteine hydrolase [Actinokineospora globicatena]GLW89867.1 isochorismatase [Actinokineospora globicatena]